MLYHFPYPCAPCPVAIQLNLDTVRKGRRRWNCHEFTGAWPAIPHARYQDNPIPEPSGREGYDQTEQQQQQAANTTPTAEFLAQLMVPWPLCARSQPDR